MPAIYRAERKHTVVLLLFLEDPPHFRIIELSLIKSTIMASVRYQKLAVACLAIACVLLVTFSAVEGKKSSSDPEITNKVRKKLSR